MCYKKNPYRIEVTRVLKLYSNIPIDVIVIIADYASESPFNDIRNVLMTLIEKKTLLKVDAQYQSWDVYLTREHDFGITWKRAGYTGSNSAQLGHMDYSIKCILNGGTTRRQRLPRYLFPSLSSQIRYMARNPEILSK